MNETLAGILRRVKEEAEDDLPRLILADWLEDGDDPRSEFVRLQVQRAALGRHHPGRRCLLRRELLLLEEHGNAWTAPLQVLGKNLPVSHRRGLMRLTVTGEELGRHGVALADSEVFSWIEQVNLSDSLPGVLSRLPEVTALSLSAFGGRRGLFFNASDLQILAGLPQTQLLRRLSLNGYALERRSLNQLARLPRLEKLTLDGARWEESFESLVESELLPRLTRLELNPPGDGGVWVTALARGNPPNALRSLVLRGEAMQGMRLQELALIPMPALRKLRIRRGGAEVFRGVAHLLAGPAGATLAEVHLDRCLASPQALRALAETAAPPLQRLKIRHCSLHDAGVLELSRAPWLERLRELRLEHCVLTAVGWAHLADTGRLGTLEELSLVGVGHGLPPLEMRLTPKVLPALRRLSLSLGLFGAGTAAGLVRNGLVAGLEWLTLSQAGVDAEFTEAMIADGGENLRALNLSQNVLGDRGVAALAGWPGLARLDFLDLSNNRIGDAGVLALARSRYLRPDTWVNLEDNRVTGRGAVALRHRLGDRVHFA